jgi:hypothetical protein
LEDLTEEVSAVANIQHFRSFAQQFVFRFSSCVLLILSSFPCASPTQMLIHKLKLEWKSNV